MDNRQYWKWAVGIEDTFVAQTAGNDRLLDEFDLTQHYLNWENDLDCIRKSGAAMVRYGIPWYRIEPECGKYDWSWTDKVMSYFDTHRELTPIIDLMHYGTPLWLKNEFMNARYPEFVSRYAAAFAQRYKGITKYYTPLNEPTVNAEWCGWSGKWPPYLKGILGYALILNQLCRGIVLTVKRLKEIQPESIMVHVEASKKYVPESRKFEQAAWFWNELRYIMWELVQGRIKYGHPLYQWAIDYNISEYDLKWYEKNRIDLDLVGINYYPQFSVNIIDKSVLENGQIPNPIMGTASDLKDIVKDIYERYNRPVFITETSYRGTVDEKIDWMEEVTKACKQMVDEGIDLYGVTWFPFFDMVDWSFRTNGLSFEENLAPFGLYSLKKMPDGRIFRIKNAAAERFEQQVREMNLRN